MGAFLGSEAACRLHRREKKMAAAVSSMVNAPTDVPMMMMAVFVRAVAEPPKILRAGEGDAAMDEEGKALGVREGVIDAVVDVVEVYETILPMMKGCCASEGGFAARTMGGRSG